MRRKREVLNLFLSVHSTLVHIEEKVNVLESMRADGMCFNPPLTKTDIAASVSVF